MLSFKQFLNESNWREVGALGGTAAGVATTLATGNPIGLMGSLFGSGLGYNLGLKRDIHNAKIKHEKLLKQHGEYHEKTRKAKQHWVDLSLIDMSKP